MSCEVTGFLECQVLTLIDNIYRCVFFGSGPRRCGWDLPCRSLWVDSSPAQARIVSSARVLDLLLLPPLIFQGSPSQEPKLAMEMGGLVWRRNAKALAQKKPHPSKPQTQTRRLAVPPQRAVRDRSFQDQNPAKYSRPVGWWLSLCFLSQVLAVIQQNSFHPSVYTGLCQTAEQ